MSVDKDGNQYYYDYEKQIIKITRAIGDMPEFQRVGMVLFKRKRVDSMESKMAECTEQIGYSRFHPKTVKILSLLCASILAVLLVGCKKEEDAGQAKDRKNTPVVGKAPVVLVENGQAAIIRIEEGYMFIVPIKSSIDAGRYKILYSESGNFKKNQQVLATGSWDTGIAIFDVLGHKLEFSGVSASSVEVGLSGFDETGGAIAKFDSTDANLLDVSELEFIESPPFDDEAFEEFFSDEVKRVKKQ